MARGCDSMPSSRLRQVEILVEPEIIKFKVAMNLFAIVILIFPALSSASCPSLESPPQIAFVPTYSKGHRYGIEEAGPFIMTCKASYPIEWNFEGPMPGAFTVKRTRQFSFHNSSLFTDCFESIVNAEKDSEVSQTGNYTCSSVADPKKTTSVYRFYYDGGLSGLFNVPSESVVEFSEKTNDNEFIIPCPSNYEKINASLVKLNQEGEEVPMAKEDGKLRYEPKIGFLLNASVFPNPIGRYKCLGHFGDTKYKKDVVQEYEVEIKMTDDTSSYSPKQHYIRLRRNENITLNCESIYDIEFVKTVSHSTKLISESVKNRPNRIRKRVASIVLQGTNDDASGEIICQTKGSNKTVVTSWKFDKGDQCRCLWKKRALAGDHGIFVCKTGRQISDEPDYRRGFFWCNNPSECQMMRRCPNERNCRLAISDHFGHPGLFVEEISYGLIKCSVQVYGSGKVADISKYDQWFQEYYEDTEDITLTSQRHVLFVGDAQQFDCRIARNALEPEFQWGFQMKDGSFQVTNDYHIKSATENSRTSEQQIILNVTDTNIQSVFCLATKWETAKTVNSTARILVQGAVDLVEDPAKVGCVNVSDVPSIVIRRSTPDNYVKSWQNITGLDIVLDFHEPSVELTCMAKYFTEWHVKGQLTVGKKSVVPSKNQASEICYQDTLTLYVYDYDIGNYTCNKVHDSGIHSSTYVYVKDDIKHLVSHGQHIAIALNNTQDWTILPCQATSPGVRTRLIRQNPERDIEVLNQSDNVLYDPKIGFKIRTSLLLTGGNLTDVFICSSEEDDEDGREKSHIVFTLESAENSSASLSIEGGEETTNSEVGIGSVIVPWVLVAFLVIINVGFFIIVRYKLMRRESGPVVHFNASNGLPAAEPGNSAPVVRPDTGIVNSAYEKFH